MSVTFSVLDSEEYLNVSNANAAHLLTALGYAPAYFGTLEAVDVLDRIGRVLRAMGSGASDEFTRPTVEGQGAGGCRFIDFGVDREYILRRLGELQALALEALRRNPNGHGALIHYS